MSDDISGKILFREIIKLYRVSFCRVFLFPEKNKLDKPSFIVYTVVVVVIGYFLRKNVLCQGSFH